MATNPASSPAAEPDGRMRELLHRISEDVKTIAQDEVELVRSEMTHSMKTAATEASVVLVSAIVGLIGFGMLCVAVVAALGSVISPLWLRLVIMAFVYLAVGGAIGSTFAKRLRRDAQPNLAVPKYETKRTIEGAKESLQQQFQHS